MLVKASLVHQEFAMRVYFARVGSKDPTLLITQFITRAPGNAPKLMGIAPRELYYLSHAWMDGSLIILIDVSYAVTEQNVLED